MKSSLSTPTELLLALRSTNPTSPRLTWYGRGGERVELSGRVLENWVAKTANFLVDELDAELGTEVELALPVHWRSLVWLLAGWGVGVTLRTPGAGVATPAPVFVTADPAQAGAAGPGALVVAVALPALAMRFPEPLPAEVLDYSGGVRAHGDVFFAAAEPEPGAVAWRGPGGPHSFAQLFGAPTPGPAPRVLVQAADGWDAVVPACLLAWRSGGSVVLLGDDVPATEHLRAVEQVSAG